MNDWVTIIGQLGVGGAMGLIIFLIYRSDKKATEARLASLIEASENKYGKLCQETEGRLAQVLHETITAMKENTQATAEMRMAIQDESKSRSEMIRLLTTINGRLTNK